jgi:hypothetical protein
MPCKNGIREALDEAKQRYRKERELDLHDASWKFWRDLVHRVHDGRDGFAGLSEPEKQYFAVGILHGDVFNGGFDQYFFNSSGSYYQHAVAGLEKMGANQACALLQRAKHVLFGFDEVPVDTASRRAKLIAHGSSSRTARLELLDHLYWEDPDELALKVAAFAKDHGLL